MLGFAMYLKDEQTASPNGNPVRQKGSVGKETRRLLSLSGAYLFGELGQKAVGLLLIPIYTSVLDTRDYGFLALMYAAVSLLVIVVTTPINRAFTRFYFHPDYKNRNKVLLFNLFILSTVKSALIAACVWEMDEFIARLLLGNASFHWFVDIFVLILFLQPMVLLFLSLLRMEEKAWLYVIVSGSQLILNASLSLYFLLHKKWGVSSLVYGDLIGMIFLVIVVFPFFVKRLEFRFSFRELLYPLRYAYPLLPTGYSSTILQVGDRYVLKYFGTISMVGTYSFGYAIGGILKLFAVEPVQKALIPIVYKQEREPGRLKDFLRKICTYYYMSIIFLCLGLSLFSREVLMVLARKPEFWDAWVVIPFIAFSFAQHGLGNFVAWGMSLMFKSIHISMILMVAAGVNIALNFVLIPIWGIVGAALATLISYLVWNALKMYYSAKFYALHFEVGRLVHITVIGAGLYLLSLLFAAGDNGWIGVSIKTLILLTYPFLLFVTGFVSEEEKEYLRKLFHEIRAKGIVTVVKQLGIAGEGPKQGVDEII
ncbi:MAG: oligosaccharide flippase family protein [Candidatus Hodarchaeota archaeon]